MKLIILVFSVLISLAYANVDFDAYMAQYQKSYGSVSEQQKRKAIFDSNLKKIDEYNKWAEANGFDSRQGITNFTDLDYSEFVKKYTGYVAGSSAVLNFKKAEIVFSPKAVAASWDWRAQGKVGAIKNQGNCGSCWAFSITAIHEVYYAIQKNKLATFSEQELVDCAPYTNGCNGADPIDAASFVLGYGHELSTDYPYVAKKNSCTYKSAKVVSKPTYGYRWTGTEANLKAVVSQTGAVAIAIYASSVFQNFKSTGIFADSSCSGITRGNQVNHAVTIVGYGTLNGRDYWLVRNSYGTGWGDAGYIKLPYGSNYCGILVEPVFFSATRYS